MKAKVIYISGGDNLVMAEINSVFSEIRKKMEWGTDIAMFAVPVASDDIMKPIDISEVVIASGFGVLDDDLKSDFNENSVEEEVIQDPICDNGEHSEIKYTENGPEISCKSADLDDTSDDVVDNNVQEVSVLDIVSNPEFHKSSDDEEIDEFDEIEKNSKPEIDDVVVQEVVVDDSISPENILQELDNIDDDLSDDENQNSEEIIVDSGIEISSVLSGISPMKQDEPDDDLDGDVLEELASEFVKSDVKDEESKPSGLSRWQQMIFSRKPKDNNTTTKKSKNEDNILSLFDSVEKQESSDDDIPSFLRPRNS